MDGHKSYSVCTILIIVDINCTQKGYILEIITQCNQRKIGIRKFYTITYESLSLHLLKKLIIPFLNVIVHTIQKLIDIG